MDTSSPTRGQLERTLSQRIQALYRDQLGHQPSQITCQIFEEKIAIILENAITAPEQLLANSGQEELAEQVRTDLEKALEPQVKALIEEVVGVPVIDLLSDAKVDTGRTGTIAVLANAPKVRN
ncbi:DUF2294 domain-containing protein [Coleofasciculus sp. FACHB-1120]|uniref:DUF2294 domain-containing protein n=1 Tax=Coleofasciculus sp. FACHB-1120 TaxID=2692783 RepID=UPI00168719D0|nr:DUF2294 domain-containing protein [Coleofasciculus sp. FACHB-1120]MBD2741730.1 DUF2294 domain-containing protein [Coleofasciculus sp. FACHB-1120]